MVDIAQKYLDEVPALKSLVESAYQANKDNIDRFNDMRRFVYITTLTDAALAACAKYGWPPLQVNTLEAFISKLSGEFAKQMPSPSTHAENNHTPAAIIDFVDGRLRYVFESAEMDNIKKEVYEECLSGGMSAAKIVMDYKSPYVFEQDIFIEKCYDPTLVFFDPMARKNHKGDGEFCCEFTPMTREVFEEKYPDFDLDDKDFVAISPDMLGLQVPWFAKEKSLNSLSRNQEVVYTCNLYKKKLVEKKLVEFVLPDGKPHAMLEEDYLRWSKEYTGNNLAPPPAIKRERKTQVTEIWLYPFVKNKYLERPSRTKFKSLPIIDFDGNGKTIEGKLERRPYHYQAVDAQKLKNMAAIAIANGVESMSNTMFLMPEEAMPTAEQDKIAYRQPQKQVGAILYKAWPQTNSSVPNPQPIVLPKQSFDPALLELFKYLSVTQQECLGNFDTQLGINQGKMSGVAFEESITQSNAAAYPFISHFMDSFSQLAQVYVECLPECYNSQQPVAIRDKDGTHKTVNINDMSDKDSPMIMLQQSLDLHVCVKADVNLELQKDRAVDVMLNLLKVFPELKGFFLQGGGITDLMDNITIRRKDTFMKKLDDYIKDQESKSVANAQKELMSNPEIVKKQIADQDFQIKQRQLALDQMQMQIDLQESKVKSYISQLESLAKIQESKAQIEVAQLNAVAEIKNKQIEQDIAIDKHISEKISDEKDRTLKVLDAGVKHAHNLNQHKQAMVGLAVDAMQQQQQAAQAAQPETSDASDASSDESETDSQPGG